MNWMKWDGCILLLGIPVLAWLALGGNSMLGAVITISSMIMFFARRARL